MSALTHVELIRQEMPATIKNICFNAGSFGPLPICVTEAMQEQMQRELQGGRLGIEAFEAIGATCQSARQAVARLLHVHEDEIALTDSTGEGLNIICSGLNWQAGDEIITTNHEHVSLLAPLYQLRERYDVVIKVADLGPIADFPAANALADLITPRTRLIAVSHVVWSTGVRLNISEVASLGRKEGILVLIDGAQSAGAIPLDLHALGVDFYAIPGQKWLCGPNGTGALYARREATRLVTATYVSYWSGEETNEGIWKLQENARRFEAGGCPTSAVVGQITALNWLEKTVGHDWLFARIADLHAYAYHALQSVPGLQLLTPRPGESGLLTFTLKDLNSQDLVSYLREQHNISIRTIPELSALRISTGFYNTEMEIDTLVRALAAY